MASISSMSERSPNPTSAIGNEKDRDVHEESGAEPEGELERESERERQTERNPCGTISDMEDENADDPSDLTEHQNEVSGFGERCDLPSALLPSGSGLLLGVSGEC